MEVYFTRHYFTSYLYIDACTCVTATATKQYPSIIIQVISSVNKWKHFIISDLMVTVRILCQQTCSKTVLYQKCPVLLVWRDVNPPSALSSQFLCCTSYWACSFHLIETLRLCLLIVPWGLNLVRRRSEYLQVILIT